MMSLSRAEPRQIPRAATALQIALALCLGVGPTPASGADEELAIIAAPEPVVILPAGLPRITSMDAEADNLIRLQEAQVRFKVDGSGLAAVIIDSGVNPSHVSFEGQLLPGRTFLAAEGVPEDQTVDTQGHGSRMAGLVAGRRVSPVVVDVDPGVAPKAKIIPAKVTEDFGEDQLAFYRRVNEALLWVLDSRERFFREHGVRVAAVNFSIGTQHNFRTADAIAADQQLQSNPVALGELQTMAQRIAALREARVAVIVAAGNEFGFFSPDQGMGFPAVCPQTISVGAVFDADSDRPMFFRDTSALRCEAGLCPPFSQRLGEVLGEAHRTDIFAPGAEITSAGPFIPGEPEQSRINRATRPGTSESAAITTGVALLVQQRHVALVEPLRPPDPLPTVDLVEDCLRAGVRFQDVEVDSDNVQGTGETFVRLDAVLALRHLTERYQQDVDRFEAAIAAGEPTDGLTILGAPVARESTE